MKRKQMGELVTVVALAIVAFFGAAIASNKALCDKPQPHASCPK